MLTFLLGTGCRIGEALGMTWNDIDFDNDLIHVRRALLYRPDEEGRSVYTISSTKTKNGVRTIPMLEDVREALFLEREFQLMFCKGKTATAKKEGRKQVSLPHFSAHNLRHTFCTRRCMTGLTLKEIQDIMGHADINTTMNIYAEVHPEVKKKSLTK